MTFICFYENHTLSLQYKLRLTTMKKTIITSKEFAKRAWDENNNDNDVVKFYKENCPSGYYLYDVSISYGKQAEITLTYREL